MGEGWSRGGGTELGEEQGGESSGGVGGHTFCREGTEQGGGVEQGGQSRGRGKGRGKQWEIRGT